MTIFLTIVRKDFTLRGKKTIYNDRTETMESLKELKARALELGVDESTVSHRGRKQAWLDAIEKKIEETLSEVSETEREAIVSDDHATAESLGLEVDRLLDIYSRVIKTQMSLLCPVQAETTEPVIIESGWGTGTIDVGEGERNFRKIEGDFILETSSGNLISSKWYPTRNNRYFLALRKFYEEKDFNYSDIEWHSNRTGVVVVDKEKYHFNVEDFGGEVRPPRVAIYDNTSSEPTRLTYHDKPYVYSQCPHRLAVLRALGCES